MIVLDNEDAIRAIASVDAVVDYILNGYVGTTATQLADGKVTDGEADLYASGADGTVVLAITMVNTHAAAVIVNLFLKPSGGTSRRIIAKDLSLAVGYSLHTDGTTIVLVNNQGKVVYTYPAHHADHENGGDDEVSIEGLSGLAADDQHVLDAEAVAAAEAAGLALASGKNIKLIANLLADHTWSGLTALMTAGAALTRTQAVYASAGKMVLADADAAASMPVIALCTPATLAEDAEGEFLLQGFFRDDTWDWTPGGLIYASLTPGALTQNVSGYTTGDQVQVVGVAITADIIYFNPSLELVEIS